jgi:hypothetical protein
VSPLSTKKEEHLHELQPSSSSSPVDADLDMDCLNAKQEDLGEPSNNNYFPREGARFEEAWSIHNFEGFLYKKEYKAPNTKLEKNIY